MSSYKRRPKRASAVLDELKLCASEERTITYGELADLVGSGSQNMGNPLGYIRDQVCLRHGRPRLDALVVQQRKPRVPSDGFFTDVDADDPVVWWLEMIQQVFAYDWSGVEIDE